MGNCYNNRRCRNLKTQNKGLTYAVYNNRCVKARLEDTSKDAIEALTSILNKMYHSSSLTYYTARFLLGNHNRLKENYNGEATVNINAGDTFDLETGKALVKERILKSYHKDFDACMCEALINIRTICVRVEHYCKKHNIDISEIPETKQIEDKIFNSGYKANKN